MSSKMWQLGPLKVPSGQSLSGVVQVDIGATTIDFPITLINGTEPGPLVLITAGMEGRNDTAVEAALRLPETLDPAQLTGRILLCPILDPLCFEADAQQSPLDGLFLKHVFPGNLEGKPTQRLAHFIMQNFVTPADLWIDLHDMVEGERAAPIVYSEPADDAQIDEQNMRLLRQSGAGVAVRRSPGTWEPAPHAVTASTAFVITKAGHNQFDDTIAQTFQHRIIHNILMSMRMLAQDAPPETPTVYLDAEPVIAIASGLWYAQVDPGQLVRKGDVLGQILKLDGITPLHQVESPVDGEVLSIRSGLATRPRLRLALIGHRPLQT